MYCRSRAQVLAADLPVTAIIFTTLQYSLASLTVVHGSDISLVNKQDNIFQ